MVSIAFTGDISFSKYMKDAWLKNDLLDEKVASFLHSADHVVANVECTLSDKPTVGGGLKHASDPAAGGFIRNKLNSRIWSLANNHILDCKAQGLLDTLQAAKDQGCLTIGAGANREEAAKPVYLDEAGGIGIFSVTFDMKSMYTPDDEPGVFFWKDTQRIQKTIDEIKSRCRWCVMVVHGQNCEFTNLPLPISKDRMKAFLDMGADVIVGHHPHVVQNYERFGEKMIFYSLGNFIFDTDYQRQRNYTQYGMLLKLHFTETQWTWESQPILIDREENRIVEGENPAIFTNIEEAEYDLLKDLVYADFVITNRAARIYLKPEKYGAYTAQDWYDYDARWMGTEGADLLREGAERAKLGLWKKARKELQHYIGKDLDFVE